MTPATVRRVVRRVLPSEHQEQTAVLSWCAAMRASLPDLDLLYAIPNGARTTMGMAKKLKAEGVKTGVPDLCLPVARGGYHALYIEMKRQRLGQLSPAQRHWGDLLRAQGNLVVVAKGADRATELLAAYLAGTYRV